MIMTPVFSVEGQLLGHIDRDLCSAISRPFSGTFIDDNSTEPSVLLGRVEAIDTFRVFRFEFYKFEFQKDGYGQNVYYLVAPEEVPKWVWKTGKAVEFCSKRWTPHVRTSD